MDLVLRCEAHELIQCGTTCACRLRQVYLLIEFPRSFSQLEELGKVTLFAQALGGL